MNAQYAGLAVPGLLFTILGFLIGGGSSTLLVCSALLRILLWALQQNDARIYLVLGALTTAYTSWSISSKKQPSAKQNPLETPSILTPGPLRPLIIPCRTTHTRIFPKKHSFGYSYLQVGIPIGWKSNVSSILGADEDPSHRSWFSVNAADYLDRGHEHLGLEGKLAQYLSSQGEQLQDYSHAYLLTAPRHLGYAFNPVSFWYLFSKTMTLQAVILEVNNTFDERRLYFMKRGADFDDTTTTTNQDTKFTHSWRKDFHVSPFNSRKGDYSLAATNPFHLPNNNSSSTAIKIDNTITLISSQGHAKLIARIFSTGSPIDPTTLTPYCTIKLLSLWFWVGLVTYPRIVKEAGKLFFKHKLNVWYRPEINKSSIGRNPTAREQIIASKFLSFLQHQLDNTSSSSQISSIEYTPPHGVPSDSKILTPTTSTTTTTTTTSKPLSLSLSLHILSPQFFTNITTAPSPVSYILASEGQPPESQVFTTSSHVLLAELLSQPSTSPSPSPVPGKRSVRMISRWEAISCWILMHFTRWCTTTTTTPTSSTNLSHHREEGKRNGMGREMDVFVIRDSAYDQGSGREREYLNAVLGLVLAKRFSGGFEGILDGIRDFLGVIVVWMGMGLVLSWIA